MTEDPIRPNVKITETPEPLEVVNTQPNDVDVLVTPNAAGECQVFLHMIADDCAFLVGNQFVSQIEAKVETQSIFDEKIINIPFTIVCTKPSEQNILIRFIASAKNADGGESHPSPFFNVVLTFDTGDRLAEIMASVEAAKNTSSEEGGQSSASHGVTETEVNAENDSTNG